VVPRFKPEDLRTTSWSGDKLITGGMAASGDLHAMGWRSRPTAAKPPWKMASRHQSITHFTHPKLRETVEIALQHCHACQINKDLRRANAKRWHYDYQPGNECLIVQHSPNKLESRKYGPFTIELVHINGTVTIRRDQHTTERMSIRYIVPYRRLP
jgi:hypothetical protein